MQRFACAVLLCLGQAVLGQELTHTAVTIGFRQNTCGDRQFLAGSGSAQCSYALGSVTTDTSAQVSGTAITAAVRSDLKAASSGIISSREDVDLSVYVAGSPGTYAVDLAFTGNASVSKATSADAYVDGTMLGLAQWRVRATGDSPDSDSKTLRVFRRTAGDGQLVDGVRYFSLGTIRLTVWLRSSNQQASASGSSAIRINVKSLPVLFGPGKDFGDGVREVLECPVGGGKTATNSVSLSNGGAQTVFRDPIATRGLPLATNIYVNSQSRFPNLKTPVGLNGAFTYGMAVRTGEDGIRYVIDADGSELPFGPATEPAAPQPGIYSRLVPTGGGWSLEQAGPPGQIHVAGNYRYDFGSSGNLLRIVDPSANIQEVAYGEDGFPIRVTDLSSKKFVRFEYETPGLIGRIIENGREAVTQLRYTGDRLQSIDLLDETGRVVTGVRYEYDSKGRLSTMVADGRPETRISWSYEEIGSGAGRANMSWGQGSSRGSTGIDYLIDESPGDTKRVGKRNAQGGTTYYDFDSAGNLVGVIRPALTGSGIPPTLKVAYDENRNPVTISDGLTTRTISYNELGKVTEIQDGAGGFWRFEYRGVDLLSVTDALGLVTALGYGDPANPHSPTMAVDGAENAWNLSYNQYGQLLSITPPAGSPTGTTTLTYDEDPDSKSYGYLKSVENGAGDRTTFDGYTLLGDVTELSTFPKDGVKNTTRFAYDAAQRVVELIAPDGSASRAEYAGKRLSKTTDQAGTVTSYEFCDVCGALEAVNGPLSKTLRLTLNRDHDVTAYIDARKKQTSYSYGNSRELRLIRYPDGTQENFEYDDTGRLSVFRNGRRQEAAISYDKAGRTEKITFSNRQPDISYTYFADGRVQSVKDEAGTTSYTYTANRLVETVTYDYSASGLSAKQSLRYSYNPDSTLRELTWSSEGATVASWSYEHDAAARIVRISTDAGDSTEYAYDREGKIVSQRNSNGTEASYSYNEARGWPAGFSWRSNGSTFASYTLTYDNGQNTVGNLTKVVEADGTEINYEYDELYRLTSESRSGAFTNTFRYDLAGNITQQNGSEFGTYDDANKMLSFGGAPVSYDADGNLTGGAALDLGTLAWDTRNKLRSRQGVSYRYDAGGRRVIREAGERTYYVFSGSTLLGEVSGVAPRVAYTWGPGGLASQRRLNAQQTRFYHFGPLGETRQLTNSAGTVTSTYSYEAYGKEQQASGSDPNPFRYGGQVGYYTDDSAVLAGARWYSPTATRWLSRDPIGYEGGDNLYAYVASNPIGALDPSGLCDCTKIVEMAESLNNNAGYGYDGPLGPGAGAYKCNAFVDDVLESTGVNPRRWFGLGGPISAGTWGNPRAVIPYFPVVEVPQPGDIVAVSYDYGDASGHVAIVIVPGQTSIGAGANGSHATGWPWNGSSPRGTPVYRRCSCSWQPPPPLAPPPQRMYVQ